MRGGKLAASMAVRPIVGKYFRRKRKRGSSIFAFFVWTLLITGFVGIASSYQERNYEGVLGALLLILCSGGYLIFRKRKTAMHRKGRSCRG